ncbi:MAG: hypothetical protein ACOX4U_03620 [Anaerovoracaceae bacterium]
MPSRVMEEPSIASSLSSVISLDMITAREEINIVNSDGFMDVHLD